MRLMIFILRKLGSSSSLQCRFSLEEGCFEQKERKNKTKFLFIVYFQKIKFIKNVFMVKNTRL